VSLEFLFPPNAFTTRQTNLTVMRFADQLLALSAKMTNDSCRSGPNSQDRSLQNEYRMLDLHDQDADSNFGDAIPISETVPSIRPCLLRVASIDSSIC